MPVIVKWLKLAPDVQIPRYRHRGDAGFDLAASEDVTIGPWERKLIPTGLKVDIPEWYEMQIRPRSGVSLKTPLMIANSPGTIDSGYRGEVKIIVFNASNKPYTIKRGDRIAQGVIVKLPEVEHVEVNKLSETSRGENGFGSTG